MIFPFLRHSENRLTKLCAILRTVIHRHKRKRIFSRFVSLIKHCDKHSHSTDRLIGAVFNIGLDEREIASVRLMKCIALFRYGKRNHLKRFTSKNLFQSAPLRRIRALSLDRLRERTYNLIFSCSVTVKNDIKSEVIIWLVDFIDNIIIEAFDTGDSSVKRAFLQKSVSNSADKHTENVADAEMHPYGLFNRLFANRFDIIIRQSHSCFLPRRSVLYSVSC